MRHCLQSSNFVIMLRFCNVADDFSNWFPAPERSLVLQMKHWHPPISAPTQLTSPPISPPHFPPSHFGNAYLYIFLTTGAPECKHDWSFAFLCITTAYFWRVSARHSEGPLWYRVSVRLGLAIGRPSLWWPGPKPVWSWSFLSLISMPMHTEHSIV